MKKPSILTKLKLEYALPFHETGLDPDSEQNREMGIDLKKFYFGYSSLSVETIFVYLMVIIWIFSSAFERKQFISGISDRNIHRYWMTNTSLIQRTEQF